MVDGLHNGLVQPPSVLSQPHGPVSRYWSIHFGSARAGGLGGLSLDSGSVAEAFTHWSERKECALQKYTMQHSSTTCHPSNDETRPMRMRSVPNNKSLIVISVCLT